MLKNDKQLSFVMASIQLQELRVMVQFEPLMVH